MDSGNSPSLIPCSEELIEETEVASSRIDESNSNSMSLLNEGFMIDSENLSISAINDPSKSSLSVNDSLQVTSEHSELVEDDEDETENTEMDLEEDGEDAEDVTGAGEEQEDANNAITTSAGRGRKKGSKNKQRKPSGEQGEDDEDQENEVDFPIPQLPLGRVKRVMGICLATTEEEEEDRNQKDKKGKGRSNVIITKEAIYLTSLATEFFVGLIGERAATVTTSNKKKTITLEHLKQSLSDTDAFSFLEGCFQPSVIRGDV